jgi:hypothetical protein
MPLDEFLASAAIGVTVMLCNWRPSVDMELPPQETATRKTADINRKRITADSLRIDTSRLQTAGKGKGQRKGERIASKHATPAFQGKKQYCGNLQKQAARLPFLPGQALKFVQLWPDQIVSFGLAMPSRIWNSSSQRLRLTVIRKFSLACSRPFLPICAANSGFVSR